MKQQIGHLYDIKIFVQIILSLTALPHMNYFTYNLNSLIFIENSHWLYIWTDYSIFWLILNSSKIRFGNKPISTKQIGVDFLCQAQRGSTINRMNLLKYYFWRFKIDTLIWNNIIGKIPGDVGIKQLSRFLALWQYHNWLGSSWLDILWLVQNWL